MNSIQAVFVRLMVLLLLASSLSWAMIIGNSQPPARMGIDLADGDSAQRTRVLVTLELAADSRFRELSLYQRASILQDARRHLLKSAGIRSTELIDTLNFSRGMVIDATPRQLRRLSRLRGIQSISPVHAIYFDNNPGLDSPTAPPGRLALAPLNPEAIKIAVIDTGLERLEFEQANLVSAACFCSRNGTGCCPNGQAVQFGVDAVPDQHGHGTAVTHLLAEEYLAHANAPLDIIAIKVLDSYGGICCPYDIAAALDWLASQHPDVKVVNISLSTGHLMDRPCDDGWAGNRIIADAVSANLLNGALVVVASGNDGSITRIPTPGCVSGVLTVGAVYLQDYDPPVVTDFGCQDAVQKANTATCFSNAGSNLDLLAPGAFLSAPGPGDSWNNQLRGTSFASPLVAGCGAALRHQDPSADARRVRARLLAGAGSALDPRTDQHWPLLACASSVALPTHD